MLLLYLYFQNNVLITIITLLIANCMFIYLWIFPSNTSNNILKFLPVSLVIRSKELDYGNLSSQLISELPSEFIKIVNGEYGHETAIHNGNKYFIYRNSDYFIICYWSTNTQSKNEWESKLLQWIQSHKQIKITNSLNQVLMQHNSFISSSYTKSTEIGQYTISENNISKIVMECNENLNNAVIITDINDQIIYFNKYARSILPLIINEYLTKIWTLDNLISVLKTKLDSWFFAKINGKLYNVNVTFHDGFIALYLYSSNDTSLLKNNRLSIMGEMSVGVCHDVNNIISILMILLDGLFEKYEEEITLMKCKQFLFKIKTLTNRILSLFANENHSKKDAFIEVITISEEWARSLNQINPRIDIKFVNHIGEIYAKIDEFYFGQIIFNIVKNGIDAVKEIPRGIVTIDCTRVEIQSSIVENNYFISSGKYAKITISNNGSNITDQQVENIFNKSKITDKEQGHGIGLGLVLDIVKRHNGLLKIDNKVQTNFVIYLPEYEKDKQIVQAYEVTKILVVEDEYITRNAICNWIKTGGYLYCDTDNLAEAEKIINSEIIDVIIIDMNINGMNSDYLINQFMNCKKIIIISGDYSARNFNHANVSYLSKPFNKKMILSKIKEICGNDKDNI